MRKRRLGVNIDHVATIRNARNEDYPDPLNAAIMVEKSGGDSVTIHLREDRRHIRDIDLKNIKKKIKIPLNLEMAPTQEMFSIAKKHLPNYVCIVPEKRIEITTEGGLNLNKKKFFISKIIKKLKKAGIRVSLFVEPNASTIRKAKNLGADCVEIHSGNFCRLYNEGKNVKAAFLKIKKSAQVAKNLGLEVHVGHGLNYKTASYISRIPSISEFNIGHFIVSESLFVGMKSVIKKFKKIIN